MVTGTDPILVAFGYGVAAVLVAYGLVPAVRALGRHLDRSSARSARRQRPARPTEALPPIRGPQAPESSLTVSERLEAIRIIRADPGTSRAVLGREQWEAMQALRLLAELEVMP